MSVLVLIGLMGAGKSTVGASVAERTGRALVDVDVTITERTGNTVRELWESGGEAAYRQLESDIVLESLSGPQDTVLAAPGGVVMDPAVRAALSSALVVWLRADPSTLCERVERDDHRPLLGDQPYTVLATMADERAALYEEAADIVVDTDHQDVDVLADHIVRALHERARTA
jgi:shikimate kinase